MCPKVLITAKEVHELIPQQLKDWGYEIDHLPEPSHEKLLKAIPFYEGLIITTYTKVTAEVIDHASQLKFIGRVGAGLENIDLVHAAIKDVQVFSSPEGNANAVGEHALALLLNLMNNITTAYIEVQQGIWKREENRGEELDGKTVGIIGYGNTGSAFAKKLRGFDVKVLAYDKFKSNYGTNWVHETSLETLKEEADIISLHIPYLEENKHFIDESFFQKLRKPIYLLHTCRGEVVDFRSLEPALQQEKIKAIGIDVYEDEPWTKAKNVPLEVYQRLLHHPKVIATPHIAGWTNESKIKLADILMQKIKKWKEGIQP